MSSPADHPDLVALLRGQLSQPATLQAGLHLETCAECRGGLVDAVVAHALMTRAVATTGRRLLGEAPSADTPVDPAVDPAVDPPVAGEQPAPAPAAPSQHPVAPVVPPVSGRRRRATLAVAAAALVAVGVGGGIAAATLLDDDAAGGSTVASTPTDAPSTTPAMPTAAPASTTLRPVRGNGTGSLWLTPRDGRAELTLRTAGMPAAGAREYYYAWLLDAEGSRLLPLGQVATSGTTTFEVDPAVLAEYAQVDVSLERDDGDPGHSADSLLRGTLA